MSERAAKPKNLNVPTSRAEQKSSERKPASKRAEVRTVAASSAASDSMELDSTTGPVAEQPDESWLKLSIGSLKQETSKLEALTRSLHDTGLPAGPAIDKLSRLKKYIRSLQPQGQQVDTLNAQIRKTQKLREAAVAQQEEQQKKLKDLAKKVEKHSQEEAALQAELEAVRKDVANETLLDNSDPAAEVKIALDTACQDLRAAVTVPDNTQGQQLMDRMDAVLGSLVKKLAPQHANQVEPMKKNASAPLLGMTVSATQKATEAELAAANAPVPLQEKEGSYAQNSREKGPARQVRGPLSALLVSLCACLDSVTGQAAAVPWRLLGTPPLPCVQRVEQAADDKNYLQLVDEAMCSSWHRQFSAQQRPRRVAVQLPLHCMCCSDACSLCRFCLAPLGALPISGARRPGTAACHLLPQCTRVIVSLAGT